MNSYAVGIETVGVMARLGSHIVEKLVRIASLAMLVAALFISASTGARALDFPVIFNAKSQGDDNGTVISLDFDKQAVVAHQLLEGPYRLVLDFEKIGYGFQPDTSSWTGAAHQVRWGDMSKSSSRIIFEMDEPFAVQEMRWLDIADDDLMRLEVAVKPASRAEFTAELDRSIRTGAIVTSRSKTDRLGAKPVAGMAARGAFKVVIDAGHGGIDSGAVGRGGTLEKNVTLTFAEELKALLQDIPGIAVEMTRNGDVFVPLDDRVRYARAQNASLFISVHADSVRQRYVRGATLYTISDKASDAVAAEVARSENLSDEIAGIKTDAEETQVVDILVDLARRETHGFSIQFARLAIDEVGQVARLIKNAHRYAGFRVLKAPDVPSVLLELGYLSNADDEKLLNDEKWRAKVANSVTSAVVRFAALSGREVAVNGE